MRASALINCVNYLKATTEVTANEVINQCELNMKPMSADILFLVGVLFAKPTDFHIDELHLIELSEGT